MAKFFEVFSHPRSIRKQVEAIAPGVRHIFSLNQTSIPVIDGQRLETELNGHFRSHRALHERRTGAVGGAAKIHHVGVAPKIRFLFEQQPIEVGRKICGGQPTHAASNDDQIMSGRDARQVEGNQVSNLMANGVLFAVHDRAFLRALR